jgi:hypothetical protein
MSRLMMTHNRLEGADSFACTAAAFCHALTSPELKPAAQFLADLHVLLAALYRDALTLPDVGAGDPDLEPAQGAWSQQSVYSRLGDHLGELRYYDDTFNPTRRGHDQLVTSDLADDFADIYGDLMDGVAAWETGDIGTRRSAVWAWRFTFWSHWGQHASGALRCLFHLESPWIGGGDSDDAV